VGWDEGITNTNTAHHRVYGETRWRFSLGAQQACCARAKAVEAIKAVKAKHRETCPQFGPHGSIRYDARTYRLMSLDRVSLNTLEGRVVCRLLLGVRQHEMLVDPAWAIGGADLVWRQGVYYLHITQSREAQPDQADQEPKGGTLGVDLGIVNLATICAANASKGSTPRTPSAACARTRARNAASRRTSITASRRPWSPKPPYRARQSRSKTSVAFASGSRFDTNIAMSGIPGLSSACANSSVINPPGLERRCIW
jgi:hypothetical protein